MWFDGLECFNFLDDETQTALNKFYSNRMLQQEEPYITVFKSKPIMGIELELVTLNPNYL